MEFFSRTKEKTYNLFKKMWVYDDKNNLRTNHCIAYGTVSAASLYLLLTRTNLYSNIKSVTCGNREE